MKSVDMLQRRAGLVIPLSAIRRRADAGIGDMRSVEPLLDWMASAGLSVLQVLPLNDLAPLDSSPYAPISAFAVDPAYASLQDIPDLAKPSSPPPGLSASPRVHFAQARAHKAANLRLAFERFTAEEVRRGTTRAADFDAYCRTHAAWLEDYALFCILMEQGQWKSWQHWPEELRRRKGAAFDKLKEDSRQALRFHPYAQWILDAQWKNVRRAAQERGILLYGDIPFGLSRQSADVWANQDDFDFTATMGAPPDEYSATGQAWGLPAYRWERMERNGDVWWKMRVARAKEHFDFFRLDHAVGFFRTWLLRGRREENGFDITDPARQRARGERFFKMALEAGDPSLPIAEDLGVIPPFVYEVLNDLKIPGYKILRWGKSGEGFRQARSLPALSVATPGNHDMSTLTAWWRGISPENRDLCWRTVSGREDPAPGFSPAVHRTLLENAYQAGSALALISFQDLFGTRERINIPGIVRGRNWTYRMPMTVEDLLENPKHLGRARFLRELAEGSGRIQGTP